ncbi:MAG: tetratricopeptide repeat protein [Syntrophales bacterium]|nr:tetratricopeptide repeat protein [Syntrophales bacterium]
MKDTWLKRVSILFAMNDWPGMLDWCRKWTKSEPENAVAWFSLGWVYDELNRYDDAIEAYRAAIRINPEHFTAWHSLGVTYNTLKRHNEAVEAYRQVLRINPEYATAWSNLGIAYINLKRYDDAIFALRQVTRINPKDADAWSNLGVAYSNLNRDDDAIGAFREALRINPEHPVARTKVIPRAFGPCGFLPGKKLGYVIPDSICKDCPYPECKKEREAENARYKASLMNAHLNDHERWLKQGMPLGATALYHIRDRKHMDYIDFDADEW